MQQGGFFTVDQKGMPFIHAGFEPTLE